ncbi:uncharacterized protein LOC123310533 [Coccinella septempunctata]|uniref:uncharacterized protein LOC123310533 n=1 Tax=Coccinella septempunctata TaxID=41139 RepID=UPI001D06CD11|nr:uncharacterized protein LOC123310533 [Coccinella septempunctata]
MAATHLMLRLRDQKKEQFNNKKNNKRQLWAGIAEELTRNKFMLGANGGERCRQKFANLTKAYLRYIRNQKTTGAAFMEHPPFFEEVHSILCEKHKTQPKHLVDSLEDEPMPEAPMPVQEAPIMDEGASCSYNTRTEPAITDRFKNLMDTPTSRTNKGDLVLQELRSHQVEQRRQFDVLAAHLKKTEEQREKLLNIMEQFFTRKRKRQEEDSDGE